MTTTADLIGTAEVARLLGKSHRTVHRLVLTGKLKPAMVAPGGHSGIYLFHRADVDRLVRTAS